ncbi:hypothetical protein B9Z19DRAFT_1125744 [Tuber borchii]|uniref:Protein kinase domain-containing protein n=1 Tax=Tuber borchii TaxID=42251 RepID=A0A2T6ZU58_TUBBO|nr:hypothetical protein B9Z19DRAFT_1125744 [Tuber borchii]
MSVHGHIIKRWQSRLVSKSPVWVKLGEIGVSKRILAQGCTPRRRLKHTALSRFWDWTRIAKPPTTLILLTFEGQVFRYYFGKLPFPEDKVKGLSPPTDDIGISLLKSMFIIQPEDRPTAPGALSHGWMAGIHSVNDNSGEGQDEVTQSRADSAPNGKRKNTLAISDEPKKEAKAASRTAWTQGRIRGYKEAAVLESTLGPGIGIDPSQLPGY